MFIEWMFLQVSSDSYRSQQMRIWYCCTLMSLDLIGDFCEIFYKCLNLEINQFSSNNRNDRFLPFPIEVTFALLLKVASFSVNVYT